MILVLRGHRLRVGKRVSTVPVDPSRISIAQGCGQDDIQLIIANVKYRYDAQCTEAGGEMEVVVTVYDVPRNSGKTTGVGGAYFRQKPSTLTVQQAPDHVRVAEN